MIVREPVGVIGACCMEHPLLMLAWKIGPALAGNSVIVKPPTNSMTAPCGEHRRGWHPARGAAGAYDDGPSVGKPMGLHMGIDMIGFTGSTERVGGSCAAPEQQPQEVVLECGGKNPRSCSKTPKPRRGDQRRQRRILEHG